MNPTSSSDDQSDLWISLDEAVLRSGLSRRTILDWSKSGKVKREKRKGRVYLWVSDLATLTPLTRVEKVAEVIPEPEVLPSVPAENYGGSNVVQIKLMGDQLKENLERQEEVLEHVTELQNSLARLEGKEVLDERTKKELSLLGNVFRSLHQQNEKVNLALVSQKDAWDEWQVKNNDREELLNKVNTSNKKASAWLYLLISASVIFFIIGFWGFREWTLDHQHAEEKVHQLEDAKSQLDVSLEREKLERIELLEKQKQEIHQLTETHENKLTQVEVKQKQEELQARLRQETQLKMQQDKFLSYLKEKDEQLLTQVAKQKKDFSEYQSNLDLQKKEEITRLEQAHQKSIEELERSESEKWQRREIEVKSLLEELRSSKGTDKKLWSQRLQELESMIDQFQEVKKVPKVPEKEVSKVVPSVKEVAESKAKPKTEKVVEPK